ncbi:peptidase M20 [Tatumella morbirosei]|uniref:Peptidase M20 n=1 Tax=Tatumella morbirosei TaxID=642227 RepID=A0A095V699_9GAMM|nr:M20 family metallo-hydrolase [Tatumella morbirosei]KGD70330.1 peptidase M20 [Tatumella morbirosei]
MSNSCAGKLAMAINQQRLVDSLEQLARFGATADGGVNRQALSVLDLQARRWLIGQAESLGCSVFTDDSANLFFRRPGTSDLPPVVTGSHTDTQPSGGKYDGCLGVMAGLECIAALNDAGITTLRPVEVAVWMNEEGSRFSPGAMGSSAFVYPERLSHYLQATDADQVTLQQALTDHHQAFPGLPHRAPIPMSAFLELHIEQGPVLEKAGISLGAVTGIQGVRWYQVICEGSAAHAGTTPMHLRRDAMSLAMTATEQLRQLGDALAGSELRITFGRWQVEPNAINTIPARVTFSVDFRHADPTVLEAFDQQLKECLPDYCQATAGFIHPPVQFPEAIVSTVTAACQALNQPFIPLRSGAFHDAMYLAAHCPTGMIFVPSRDGISHNPAEFTEPADLTAGTRVLAWCLAELANQSETPEIL